MPSHPRTWARSVGVVLVGALLFGLAGTTPATAGDHRAPKASRPAAVVPTDASATTKAALADVQQELEKLATKVAATNARLVAASARLSLARQAAIDAKRRAAKAKLLAGRASRELGRYASNAYRAGPMAEATAVLGSANPGQLLRTASMISIVGDHQSETVRQLHQANAMASAAAVLARKSRAKAHSATVEAKRLKLRSHQQLARAVELLSQLRAKADREAAAAQQRQLVEAQAAAQVSLARGFAEAPAAATAAGPQPGLPADAGADPGDGLPGADHLRPRAERAKRLIMGTFGVTDIGGWRPSDSISDDHPNGRALDVMMSGDGNAADPAHVDLGWAVARWAQANAAPLGVTYVIWQARIWSVQRSAEGWRDYTANFPYGSQVNPTTLHLNHVHISFG